MGNSPYTKKKVVFIFNPVSGGLRLIPIKSLIERHINKDLFDYQIIDTEYAGHAYQIARNCVEENVDIAVAVGGDGTVNEVGKGLVGSSTALGIIPCGSGNGLARHLGISTDPFKSIKWLSKSTIQNIDYGLINEHPFFCTCGTGFDAQISLSFAESKTRGPITYVEKILHEVLTYKPIHYNIVVDGQEIDTDAYIVTCANASQWGNNAYIAPAASLKDGLLDVCIVPPFSTIDIPLMAYQLFNKQLDKSKNILQYKCREITILRESAGAAHFDGEPTMLGKEVKIKIVPQGIKMAVPDKPHRI